MSVFTFLFMCECMCACAWKRACGLYMCTHFFVHVYAFFVHVYVHFYVRIFFMCMYICLHLSLCTTKYLFSCTKTNVYVSTFESIKIHTFFSYTSLRVCLSTFKFQYNNEHVCSCVNPTCLYLPQHAHTHRTLTIPTDTSSGLSGIYLTVFEGRFMKTFSSVEWNYREICYT